MSKQIKFRVWDKNNCCFLEDMNGWGMVFKSLETKQFEPLNMFLGSGYAIQEFTGLKDKNEKEIYEGDILNSGGSKWSAVVKFERGGFKFNGWGMDRFTELQVIGNIFENKDLIK